MSWIFFMLLMALFISKHQKKLVFVSLSMLFFFSNAFIFNEFSRLWGLKKSMNTDIQYDVGIVLGGVADFDKKSNLLNFNNYSDRLFFAKKLFLNEKINKILFSGGNGELFSNDYVEAIEMKKFLMKNGINENDILIEARSRNTHENIKNSIEICEEMKQHWEVFLENHERFNEKKVKAAGVRARKAIDEIKKLATKYRSTCLAESKEI